MDARTIEAETPKKEAGKTAADVELLTDVGALSKEHVAFARALSKCGDPTRAYLASHPRCHNETSAKRQGRKLAQLPGVVAFLARLKSETIGAEGDKVAWEHELRAIAYAGVNLKKVPVKEKLSALRTLGESKGWLKAPSSGTGVRAVFNFRIGGKLLGSQGRDRTISVGMDTTEAEIVAPAAQIEAAPVIESDPEPAAVEVERNGGVLFDVDNT